MPTGKISYEAKYITDELRRDSLDTNCVNKHDIDAVLKHRGNAAGDGKAQYLVKAALTFHFFRRYFAYRFHFMIKDYTNWRGSHTPINYKVRQISRD